MKPNEIVLYLLRKLLADLNAYTPNGKMSDDLAQLMDGIAKGIGHIQVRPGDEEARNLVGNQMQRIENAKEAITEGCHDDALRLSKVALTMVLAQRQSFV